MTSKKKTNISIQVVYVSELNQPWIKMVNCISGDTVFSVINKSGFEKEFPDINLNDCKLAIYSNPVDLNDTVDNMDRIEICRPLKCCPKEARRLRALKNKDIKKK